MEMTGGLRFFRLLLIVLLIVCILLSVYIVRTRQEHEVQRERLDQQYRAHLAISLSLFFTDITGLSEDEISEAITQALIHSYFARNITFFTSYSDRQDLTDLILTIEDTIRNRRFSEVEQTIIEDLLRLPTNLDSTELVASITEGLQEVSRLPHAPT